MFVLFPEEEKSYNVEKQDISGMEIVVNDIKYDKTGDVLHRKNNEWEYNVTLHFGESKTSTVKEIQNVLKNEYIRLKNDK